MKEFVKYVGVIVMLIGVAVLAIPFLQGTTSNLTLGIGLLLVIEGFLGHIFVNNMKSSTASNIVWAILLLIVPFALFFFAKKIAYPNNEL